MNEFLLGFLLTASPGIGLMVALLVEFLSGCFQKRKPDTLNAVFRKGDEALSRIIKSRLSSVPGHEAAGDGNPRTI